MAYPATIPAPDHGLSDVRLHTVLVRVLRVAFPHDRFPDGPYERTASALLELAAADLRHQDVLRAGLESLDGAAGGDFASTSEADALALLQRVESTAFFTFVRANTVTTLYNDPDTWELLGYEGPSFDQGGYIHRGFDDLDWLPEPRVDSYSGEIAYTEQGPLPYEVATAAASTTRKA